MAVVKKSNILVVGASSGLGEACAKRLLEDQHVVFGTSRKSPIAPELQKDALTMLRMDVTDEASVKQAVEHVIATVGHIDVVINCAGITFAGAVEEMAIDEYETQMQTNFLGMVRVVQAVLPHMRKQQNGLLINVSSIGGFIGMPFQSAYSASKFAVEGFTESLRIEVKPYGIKALLLQPGDFNTAITNHRFYSRGHVPDSPYYQACQHAVNVTAQGEINGMSPRVMADKVADLLIIKKPSVRYTTGPFMQRIAARLKYWIPNKLFENLIAKEFKQ